LYEQRWVAKLNRQFSNIALHALDKRKHERCTRGIGGLRDRPGYTTMIGDTVDYPYFAFQCPH
jgi:hypothetical protein